LHFLQHISLKLGNSKESVATKVANVATETFWLESAGFVSKVMLVFTVFSRNLISSTAKMVSHGLLKYSTACPLDINIYRGVKMCFLAALAEIEKLTQK
jgi:hypothetical protein